jgi:hypothetical protein
MSVVDAIENISADDLVRPLQPASKTVFLNEWQGDDKNDGLASDKPVFTRERGLKIAVREGAQAFDIRGSAAYIEKITGGKMTE